MIKKERKGTETHAVSLVTLIDPSSPVSEQYRTIRTNLQFTSSIDRQLQTIVITSSGPSEGKSTTAANLAVVFANSGSRVLLVDADMRKPTIHKTFQLPNTQGLSTMLSTGRGIEETVQNTVVVNLFALTSGPKPPNPSELLNSRRMDQIITDARRGYDVIIFDMPPIVAVTDAQIMASKVDGTLLVVRENVTKKEALTKANELLKLVNARVLGAIYNGFETSKDESYYYYSD